MLYLSMLCLSSSFNMTLINQSPPTFSSSVAFLAKISRTYELAAFFLANSKNFSPTTKRIPHTTSPDISLDNEYLEQCTVHTDEYTYTSLNQSNQFVDPITGVHNNTQEELRAHVKRLSLIGYREQRKPWPQPLHQEQARYYIIDSVGATSFKVGPYFEPL